MMAPILAIQQFLYACLVGAALGAIYGFLRPLRPKRTTLADLLFFLAVLYGWLFVQFEICRADIRFVYSIAMAAGGFLWELTIGRLLRPVFSVFWNTFRKIMAVFLMPLKIFCKKMKILFAYVKKWVTIKWSNRRHNLSKFGGKNHGRIQKDPQPRSAGKTAQWNADRDHDRDRHRIVYGSLDGAAPFQNHTGKPHG